MKSAQVVILIAAAVCISGCGLFRKKGPGPMGTPGAGKTPVTIGDGSIYLNTDPLISSTLWSTNPTGVISAPTLTTIAEVDLFQRGAPNATILCDAGGHAPPPSQCPATIAVSIDDAAGHQGTMTIATGAAGASITGSKAAGGVNWFVFGEDQRGLDDVQVGRHLRITQITGTNINPDTSAGSPYGQDPNTVRITTPPVRIRIVFPLP